MLDPFAAIIEAVAGDILKVGCAAAVIALAIGIGVGVVIGLLINI